VYFCIYRSAYLWHALEIWRKGVLMYICFQYIVEGWMQFHWAVIPPEVVLVRMCGWRFVRPSPLGTGFSNAVFLQSRSSFQATASQPRQLQLRRPKHPNYASEQRRVESFRGARIPAGQSVGVLAKAGFFHVGQWPQFITISFFVKL